MRAWVMAIMVGLLVVGCGSNAEIDYGAPPATTMPASCPDPPAPDEGIGFPDDSPLKPLADDFFLQKDWKPALVDFEKALSGVRDKRAVHEKLAIIYRELGMKEISEQHTKLSQELMNTQAPLVPQVRH